MATRPSTLADVAASVQRAYDLCLATRTSATKDGAKALAEVARQHLRVALDELAEIRARETAA